MKVSVQYATDHFERLVSAVHRGEAVEIECAGQPALQLVRSSPFKQAAPSAKRVLGAGKAFAHLPSAEELERIDREWKQGLEDRAAGLSAE